MTRRRSLVDVVYFIR